MKLIAIGGGLAALASSAGGQVTCGTFGHFTTCNGGVSSNVTPEDFSPVLPLPPRQHSYAEIRQHNADMLRAAVGRLIVKHRCDDAVSAAMSGGDFDLAERAKALCLK